MIRAPLLSILPVSMSTLAIGSIVTQPALPSLIVRGSPVGHRVTWKTVMHDSDEQHLIAQKTKTANETIGDTFFALRSLPTCSHLFPRVDWGGSTF